MNLINQSFELDTHIGSDGILHLALPLAVKNTAVRITINCKPMDSAESETHSQVSTALGTDVAHVSDAKN